MHTETISTFRVEGCEAGWRILVSEGGEERPLQAFPERWTAVQYARAQFDHLISRGGHAALKAGGPGRLHWG